MKKCRSSLTLSDGALVIAFLGWSVEMDPQVGPSRDNTTDGHGLCPLVGPGQI